MIDPARRERQRRLDVVRLQIGKFIHDLGLGKARRQKVEHIDDANP
jgi:hypothetical protein